MPPLPRCLAAAGSVLVATACTPIGGSGPPVTGAATAPYRAMILSTVSSGLQSGSQANVQPQTQIGSNGQQLYVFVFGNNNVVTVDQQNLMPFLNLNWVNQAMGQTQIAGDVSDTSPAGSLQWDPASLTALLGTAGPSPALPVASPTPVPACQAAASTPAPSPLASPTVAPALVVVPSQLPPVTASDAPASAGAP